MVNVKEESFFPKWSLPLVLLCVTVVKTVSEGFYGAYHRSFKKMKIELILVMKIDEGESSSTAWVLFYESSLFTSALPFNLCCIKFNISVTESVKEHIWRVSLLGSPA